MAKWSEELACVIIIIVLCRSCNVVVLRIFFCLCVFFVFSLAADRFKPGTLPAFLMLQRRRWNVFLILCVQLHHQSPRLSCELLYCIIRFIAASQCKHSASQNPCACFVACARVSVSMSVFVSVSGSIMRTHTLSLTHTHTLSLSLDLSLSLSRPLDLSRPLSTSLSRPLSRPLDLSFQPGS